MDKDTILSKETEKQLCNLGKEVFLNDFPNPDRKECPDSDLVKRIATGKVAPEEEDKWIDHFASCSPCSKEFSKFRRQFKHRKRSRLMGSSVIVTVAVCVSFWLTVRQHSQVNSIAHIPANVNGRTYPIKVLDLSNWSGVRGDEGTPNSQRKPLELHRGKVTLSIHLPFGSEPVRYRVEFLQKSKKPLLKLAGVARIEDGNTILNFRVNLEQLPAGQYKLGIRQPPWGWRYLAVKVD